MCLCEFFWICVHTKTYMYKSQSFSCRNYFCKVSVIEKRCFMAVLLSTIALLYLETEFISTMQQEKPGQMC